MRRHELINYCLSVTRSRNKTSRYLEIGVDNPNSTFNNVHAGSKLGVDPYMDDTKCHIWNDSNKRFLMDGIHGEFHKKTSDEFFSDFDGELDVIFIDGLHTEEQVDKDFFNAMRHLNSSGIILIDDVLPTSPVHIKMPPDPGQEWMGTVFRSFWKIRHMHGICSGVVRECGVGFAFRMPGYKYNTGVDVSMLSNETAFLTLCANQHIFNPMSFSHFAGIYR